MKLRVLDAEGDPDLEGLVARIAAGDEMALARLFDATQSAIYSLARHVIGDDGAAEETTLDVYSQVWREADRFAAKRGSVWSWMLSIARSRAIDRRRAATGVVRGLERPLQDDFADGLSFPDSAAAPDEQSFIAERRRRVAAALARLAREQQEAIRCAFFLGMSHSEVASHLRQPLGTVKTRIRTGLARLRDELRADDPKVQCA